MGEGSIDSVPVYTRRIAEIALRHSASYVILSHNHPGGDPRPSKKDISITLEIIGALRPLGIGICDHIIVADKAYYSFLDKGNHIHTLESRGMAVAAEDSLSYLQQMCIRDRILDEATSALDNESEHIVQQSLAALAKGRTTFTIAHRLSTIQGADLILVLTEEGIAEQGTHEQLLQKHGIYHDLYSLSTQQK